MILRDDNTDHTSLVGPTDPLVTNEVRLVGHVSKPLEMKEMPSGDLLGKWALVVKRPQRIDPVDEAGSDDSASNDAAAPRRRQSHDTIDCISFDMKLIERLSDIPPRTRLEVRGALRRRFYPGQEGRQSSYAVEAFTVVVLSTPATVESATPVEDVANAKSAGPAEPSDLSERAELVTTVG